MKQTDVGYDTDKKMWFLQNWSDTRWLLGLGLIENSDLEFNGTPFDTYSWADQSNPNISHGRIRFFDNSSVSSITKGGLSKQVKVDSSEKINFTQFSGVDVEIKYNVEDMSWGLILPDRTLKTNNIIGILTGKCDDNPIRVKLKNCNIIYSWIVTLINTELSIQQ